MAWFKKEKKELKELKNNLAINRLKVENQGLKDELKKKVFFDSSITYNEEELKKAYQKVFNGGEYSKMVFHDLWKKTMMQSQGANQHCSTDYKQGARDVMIWIMCRSCMNPDSMFSLVNSVVSKQARK